MFQSDQIIKNQVQHKLDSDKRVNVEDVNIYVDEGDVTLKGSVPNYMAKQAAWEHTLSTRGINYVNNQIKVDYPTLLAMSSESDLASSVADVLALDSSLATQDVKVAIDDGNLKLVGAVESFSQKQKLAELAQNIPGITEVVNKLSVIPTGDFDDKDIAQNIHSILEKSLYVESNNISLKVDNGIVTLSGRVRNWATKRTTISLVRNTPGVRKVVDNLEIRSSRKNA